MIFSLHVLPAALNDIQVSYDWYEEQSEDLGERYLEYIDKGFDDIIQNPFYQIRYSISGAILWKFFLLWFIIISMKRKN